MGDYSCPPYCKVEHKHINKEKVNGLKGTSDSSLFSEENKKKMIEKINDNVNIPIINEKTEEKYSLHYLKL